MAIINQPFQGQLGEILKSEMKNNYSTFIIFSAFAKNSGVLRLKDAFKDYRKNGGTTTAFIGIDLDGTSYEALLNLYSLCDNLYVIHSESASTTYHSKVYLLKNDDTAWCAVGSNNLTGGGLWTNFESCIISTYSLPHEQAELDSIQEVLQKYMDDSYECSTKITCKEDIDTLLEAGYISKEVTQRIEIVERRKTQKSKQKKTSLFGKEKVSMPTIISTSKPKSKGSKTETIPTADYAVDIPFTNFTAFTNEQFWFEMRKSTGGSRNILDLSKLGVIGSGSVRGTTYEYTNDSSKMYGGVKFFELDPDDTDKEKDIIINFKGKDYFYSTIKFAPDNGSWRIQLKGAPLDGTDELSKFGNHGDFVQKILVFEKIKSDYYVLSLLDESELPRIKSLSRVWAYNGNSTTSKAYGML